MERKIDSDHTPQLKKEEKRRFRRLLPAILVVMLLVAIGILFNRIHTKAGIIKEQTQASIKKDRPIPNVVTLELIPATIRDQIDLPGVTEPWVELQIMAEVAGKVTAKMVKEGAAVRKGDLLASIDYRDYQNAHRSAKASYELAVSDLKRLEKLHQRKERGNFL